MAADTCQRSEDGCCHFIDLRTSMCTSGSKSHQTGTWEVIFFHRKFLPEMVFKILCEEMD